MDEFMTDDEIDRLSAEVLDEFTRRLPTWSLCAIRYLTLMDLQNKCRQDAMRVTLSEIWKKLAPGQPVPGGEISAADRTQIALDRKRMEEGWKALVVLTRAMKVKDGPPTATSSIRWF